ncbi:MAG: autotransporter-associated beta strand repeat-containing protein, partial [Verrucomicrobia bacterium]|nr:autotransporter-associated beta strand repeat-containing protein [Verrucomicrobiota bacterium]
MPKKWILIAVLLHTGCLYAATPVDSTWNGMAGDGQWFTGGNWSPQSVPQAAGDTANFNDPTPTAPTTITITDGGVILTTLNFDYSMSYTIAQNTGVLGFSGSSAALNVTTVNGNGSYTINPNIELLSDLAIMQNSLGNLTIVGQFLNSGSVTKSGIGTMIIQADNSGYGGSMTIEAGTVSVSNDNGLGGPSNTVTIENGVLSYSNTTSSSRPFTLSGNASIQAVAGKTVTLGGVISGSGSLTISDAGTIILTADNQYVNTTISVGTLQVSNDNNLGVTAGSLNIGNGQLNIPVSTARSGAITGNATINSANAITLSGQFNGTGNLTLTGGGTFTLTGANSYSGPTYVGTGTNLIGTTTSLTSSITLQTGTSTVTFNQNFDGSYPNTIAGPGGSQLTKSGSGNILFSGNSAGFVGATSISAGTLTVNGSLAGSATTVSSGATLAGLGTVGATTNSGTLDPGMGDTIGTLSINGALIYTAGASTNITIAPLVADQIAVNGSATISGPLEINPIPAFYGFTARYPIVTTSTGLTGPFSSVTSSVAGFFPSVTYTGTEAILSMLFA